MVSTFFALAGDARRDRAVRFAGESRRTTRLAGSQFRAIGDFTGDGLVAFDDFVT